MDSEPKAVLLDKGGRPGWILVIPVSLRAGLIATTLKSSPPKKHKQWDETSMICTMEAVTSEVNQAAKKFGVLPTRIVQKKVA